jgi:hypothetical protein
MNRMSDRRRRVWWLSVVLLLTPVAGRASQHPPAAAKTGAPATRRAVHTADGRRPDLQGVWNFSSLTPLERPAEFAGKEVVTGDEAAALQKLRQRAPEGPVGTTFAQVGAYDLDTWYEDAAHGEKRHLKVSELRTSLIVDPPDGRLPFTPLGHQRAAASAAAYFREWAGGPEDRTLPERCLIGFNAGPPLMPSSYNNNMQIFQTRDYVVVLSEMNHTARRIPLDGRPHLPPAVRQWSGDSRGHWEGETLVVETTNFSDQPLLLPGFTASSEKRLVERFTRLDRDTLRYEFTVTDPPIYSAPWTARVDMQRGAAVYEYACHEGNYALMNMLLASRAMDRKAAQPQTTPSNPR